LLPSGGLGSLDGKGGSHMRTALANHLGEFVHCQGWIKSWDVIEEKNQFQLTVHKPTITTPDKNLLFKHQEVISKEDHLHLFFPVELLSTFKDRHSLYDLISFSGNVIQYIRSNGTLDFGVKATETTTLHIELENLIDYALEITQKNKGCMDNKYLACMQFVLIPELHRLNGLLEDAGDRLPTYSRTYREYSDQIQIWLTAVNWGIEMVSTWMQSRSYRRKCIRKRNKLNRRKKHLGFCTT